MVYVMWSSQNWDVRCREDDHKRVFTGLELGRLKEGRVIVGCARGRSRVRHSREEAERARQHGHYGIFVFTLAVVPYTAIDVPEAKNER